MALASGVKLGPYELAGSIGAGGMGEVYRAHDARLGRDVAIKIISASFAEDAGRVHRFEQEARAAAALNHPNILAVYDIGTYDGSPYIVSELLEGATLRDRLREGPLPMRKIVDYALQIARGLAAAHDRGIVHRDLKPDNIFITHDGRAKILDFGLAKLTRRETAVEDLTRTIHSEPGMVLGTVGYMSPEQVRGKEADARSDLFSFGAVLYEMVSGLRAFKGDSSADILSAILKEEPQDLIDINASVSPALDRIVRHCLEKNPAERFQSAHDLAFDIETLSSISKSSKEIALPPEPPPKTRVWLWPILAALLLAIAGVAFFAGHSRRAVSMPVFHQLTHRTGTIYGARYTSDGNSVLYSAAWEDSPVELFTSRSDSVESRSLAPKTLLAAVSSKNQLAVLLEPRMLAAGTISLADGTLAVLPLEGGAPRPVLQHVNYADWTPDGSELAVIRAVPGVSVIANQLQFPIDTTIYTPSRGWISHVRFSPDGKNLAIQEHVPSGDDGKLVILSRTGKKIAESPHYGSINSLAWVSNDEVWFTATPGDDSRSVHGMNLRGQIRDIYRAPEDLTIYDVAADGRVLLTGDNSHLLLMGGMAGSPDKDLTWLGWSLAAAISDDGSTVLFSESGPAVGGKGVAFVRKLDRNSPALALGDGLPTAISPDGNWVATLDETVPPNVVLLPTGVGKPVQLTANGWEYTRSMHWMPDSSALVVNAVEPGHKPRVYLIDVKSKKIQPVLPEGIRGGLPSPDGKLLLGSDGDTRKIYTLKGNEVGTVVQVSESGAKLPQLDARELIDRWTKDGKSLFIWNYEGVPRLDRLEIASGKRVSMYSIIPPDSSGIVNFTYCRASADGKAHVCSAHRLLSDLFVVNGLR
jgi:eukaryotic-like serine/threonine-protein kinase